MTIDTPAHRDCFFTAQDGIRLYYRDYPSASSANGHKPVALCLPGLARNSKDFDGIARRLQRHHRVLAPDYRGRGRSAWDRQWTRYEPRIYLNDIRHLLTLANVHRAVVVGTSLGGIMAMALGVVMPTVLAGVVLNDVGPDLPPAGINRILAYLGEDHSQPDWQTAAQNLRRMMPQLSLKTDEEWMRFARCTYREGQDGRLHYDWDPNIVRPILEGKEPRPDLWPFFRSLRRLPVLVVRGGISDILTHATFERMVDTHPDLHTVVVPEVGHAPTLDEPPAQEAIDEFLDRC